MKRGGYRIIDLQDKLITLDSETGVEIPGIYEAIEGNYRKALLISGLTTTDGEVTPTITEFGDFFATARIVESDFVINSIEAGVKLTINDDDEVTVTAADVTGYVALASTTGVGVVSVGTGLAVDSDGELSVSAS